MTELSIDQPNRVGVAPSKTLPDQEHSGLTHDAAPLGRWTGLRARLMLFVTLVLLGPFGFMVYLVYANYEQSRASILKDINIYSQNMTDYDYGIGASVRQVLLALAQNDDVLEHRSERCSADVKAILAAEPRYAGIGAAKPDGTVFCHSSTVLPQGQNMADRDWFQEALAKRSYTSGHYIIGRNLAKPILVFAYPAVENDAVKAVVFIALDLAWLSRSLRLPSARAQPAAYFFHRNGTILARSHDWERAIGRSITDQRLLAALRSGRESEIIAKGLTGIERIYVLRTLKAIGGSSLYFTVGVNTKALVFEALSELKVALLFFLFITILTYLVAWQGSAVAILNPVRNLRDAMNRFKGGALPARSNDQYPRNEIGFLARTFDNMAEAIHHAQSQERKKTRDFEALMRASPAAIIALDRATNVIWWSAAAERIFGYTAAEALGYPHPVVPAPESGHFRDHFDRAIAGQALRNIRGQRQTKDGRIVEVEFSSAPLLNAEQNVVGVVYVVNDVTERVQLERQFLQAQKMEAVGQLTGGIAHDFNNLLGVLIGNLDLIRDRAANDRETLELADAALEAGLRGAELNKRLLAFSRRQALAPKTVNVNAALNDMTRMLRRSLGERVKIELHCSEDVWPVRIDPVQLETAIVNLSLNARDAMPDGGTLTLETRNVPLDADYTSRHENLKPGDYAMIAVSDNGVGMTPEVLSKVFNPFFTTKPVGQGTGLGLSMVYGFLKQSGGHVNVYSEPGKGTAFRLYMPRDMSVEQSVAPPVPEKNDVTNNNELILAVEDNPDMRRVTVRQLKEMGYRMAEAENADRALALLDGGLKPDLVFLDVVMPGSMDGISLARHIENKFPSVGILLTSGFTERAYAESRKEDNRMPSAPLLSKPYRKDDLASAVRAALDKRRKGSTPP